MDKIKRYLLLYLAILLVILSFSALGQYNLAYASNRIDEIIEETEASRRRVYLGGELLGFDVDLRGAMVVEMSGVDTEGGFVSIKNRLKEGDIILSIEGKSVKSGDDISEILNGEKKSEFEFLIERDGKQLQLNISPLIDRISGQYRLGVSVKSMISGLGTVTYKKRDGSFGALGHSVSGENNLDANGTVYGCRILGIDKGERGKAGSIKGALVKNERVGEVSKNIKYGLYGTINNPDGELYDVASREEVVLGRAMICSEISGNREYYDIEILKLNYQSEQSEKGMIIKVTDERLLRLTGGIVQGMSGSPIIQNGKIIGAVTHVLIADPTKGYGIYIDWMMKN